MWETLRQWDQDLFVFLNGLGAESWDSFWIFITGIQNWFFLYITFILLIIKYYKRRSGILVSLLMLMSLVLSFGLKFITKLSVARLRPNNDPSLEETIRILQHPIDYSFFSGHAAVSFAVTTFMVFSLRKFTKWIYLLFVWPILFSMSRIYVGVHYPSDIFVGMTIGILIGLLTYQLQKKLKIE